MTQYTDVFTGSNITPSNVALTVLDLTADVTLFWPQEAQPNQPVASSIVQIDSSDAADWVITLPDARQASPGEPILFNNLSAQQVIVSDAAGGQVVAVPAATQWQVYLSDNSTQAGTWKAYQFGATVSTANAAGLAGYGIRAIGATLNQSTVITNVSAGLTFAASDRAAFYNFQGAGAGEVFTLPNPVTVGNDWFVQLRNSGSASFDVAAPGSSTIDARSSLTFNTSDSCFIVCDGADFYTLGLGQDPVFAFDYVAVDVTGSVDYVLSGAELNRIAYEFTGTLGASLNVIVPATVQQYWVYDNTDAGAFTLGIATATQVAPLLLTRGDRIISFCDGANVVPTQAAAVTGAINGGTF